MRNQTILLALVAALTSSGCKMVECADGTIERDGKCMADDNSHELPKCGPFTELQGDQCVPMFPPTICEEGAEFELDPTTGITTCKGGGETPCGFPLTCSKPTGATKQTICGQLYDFETNLPFQATDAPATGEPATKCDPMAPTTAGPCALRMRVYDALAFAANPSAATELMVGDTYLDNCGRFRVKDVETSGTGPFIGIGADDASGLGPTGVTVTTAIAISKSPGNASGNLEHWIVTMATIGKWANMPPLSGGIYAAVFRAHKAGNPGAATDLQAGVTITKNNQTIPNNDFYFSDADAKRTTVGAGTSTGANGTVLVTNAVAAEGVIYGGQGGLGAGCRWDPHAGASLPGIVFIQLFKKLDIVGQTCMD